MSDTPIDLIVHATHKAGFQVGGIGAVLEGLAGAPAYNRSVARTILVGSMDTGNPAEMERLVAPSNHLKLIFSPWHQVDEAPAALSAGFHQVQRTYRSHILYGRRTVGATEHEVLLVDARRADLRETNRFKGELWSHYRIESNRYEWNEEYDLVVKAAGPAYAALELLKRPGENECFMIAHEWMGVPLALCALIQAPARWQTVFYAHETATARMLVEDHPGHDTRFYNVLRQTRAAGLTLSHVFGDRSDYHKHILLKQAARMDGILAVGPWVEQELRFLGVGFKDAAIDLVYNGISYSEIDHDERLLATERLRDYCQNLLGYRPDYVLTHVTRMSISKGLWRDIRVLEHLDQLLHKDGKRAVLFVLTTVVPAGRPVEDVLRWEMQYGWPVVHHTGNGDLVGHEVSLYRGFEAFNARSQAVKIVLVNQFGWSRECCGETMPAGMRFDDIRRGTHVEFGQSIYEPFGISQVEPLAYGALSVVSNVCGCVGFVEQAGEQVGLTRLPNFLQADYTTLSNGLQVYSPWDALRINQEIRDRLERTNSYNVALAIRATLPGTPAQDRALLNRGQRVSREMQWSVVAQDLFVPALRRIQARCRQPSSGK